MDNNKEYTWIPFYMEFADKLKEYINQRDELIRIIIGIYNDLGMKLPTLEKRGEPLTDIDPFTVFGLFNKGISDANRISICRKFAEKMKMTSEIPDSFYGIPVLNNMSATFYWFKDDRNEKDIDNLWGIFETALLYADNSTEDNRIKFCNCFDAVLKQSGTKWNITFALYWIRPYTFIGLDSCNRTYLENAKDNKIIDYVANKLKKVPSGEEYLNICETLKSIISASDTEYKDFPTLSHLAWEYLKDTKVDEWFPSLDEYNPDITTEEWIELLNDNDVFNENSLKVMKRIYDCGGKASCKELSVKYGESPNFYINASTHAAKKIINATGCPTMPRNKEKTRYWTILYVGRDAYKNDDGEYIWKLRDELKNALSRVDLSDIALYENNGNNDKPAWLLTWNPSKWDWVEYDSAITIAKSGEEYQTSWNCSNHNATIGDTVYMVKLGDPSTPRGIFATGYIISNPYEDDNYDESKETKLKYIDIKLTKILDYRTDDIITTNDLKDLFPEQNWSPQSSGISIKQNAAKWLADNWTSVEDTRTDEPVIWKISHGTYVFDSELREFFIDNKIVVVNKNTNKVAYQPISQGQAYMEDIKKGDYFYLCHSGEIVLFGQFTENEPKLCEEFVNQWNDYDWYERKYRVIAPSKDREKYTGKKKAWTSNFNSTCVKVTDNKLFEELILTPYFDLTLEDLNTNAVKIPANPLYSDSDFLNDVFISESEYTKLKNLLLRKKNIILQGAPGVGKTYVSKRLAYALMGEKDDTRIEFVQFHQNYSYEDFVMGYRPNGDGFELTTGIFYDFCKRAEEDSERDYFFIIDEINRGNLSKIFGELLMLIETDKRKSSGYSVSLAYNKQPFSVPDKLHIIGMMNTADRSLAMIDYALRRRFSFYEMKPAFDSENFSIFSASVDSVLFDKTIDAVKQLNKAVSSDSSLGKGFEIGHSYFCSASPENITDEYIKSVVEYDIIPTLEEYWFDDTDKLEKWKKVLYQAIGADYDE